MDNNEFSTLPSLLVREACLRAFQMCPHLADENSRNGKSDTKMFYHPENPGLQFEKYY